MKSITQLKNLKGKIALVRVDFNVPIRGGKILDDFRIKKALPTIKFLQKKGAKIILISHLGKESGRTLKPVADYLGKIYRGQVSFSVGSLSPRARGALTLGPSACERPSQENICPIILLENLRLNKGEESNSPAFAKQLARLGDIYVNDAFPVCHREHASIVGVPKYLPAYAGFQLENEVKNLKMAEHPARPFLFILGGAKFETKIPLIKKYLKKSDGVFIGGALMNNFFKEKGIDVGKSLVAKNSLFRQGFGGQVGLKKLMKNKKLILPIDVVIKNKAFIDIGGKTTELLIGLIKRSKFVLMNGPMGNYEKGFGQATEKILKALAKSKAKVIIGGGDTVTCLQQAISKSKFSISNKKLFISTGGGATLEFLSKGTLPGIKALR